MKLSRIGIKTQHHRGNEEAKHHEMLLQGSLLRRHGAGLYGFSHLLFKSMKKLEAIISSTLEDFGCAQVLLPILHPKQVWDKSDRWQKYQDKKIMLTIKDRTGEYFCIAPTAEEMMVEFAKNVATSYKDLPINLFQISDKFRDEIRTRGGLLRSKEFLMKDGYSFHANWECLGKEFINMRNCYKTIFEKLELPVAIVKADSGDMGGKESEEFMCPSTIGEDTILYDENTGLGFNVEVLDNKGLNKGCSIAAARNLKEIKAIELGHIFQLGTFYSTSMGVGFVDKDGKQQPYVMGCYGIGVTRVMATMLERACDDNGLIFPAVIAPYKCTIVAATGFEKQAEELYKNLKENNIEVLIDDRINQTFGSKLKDAALIGMPYTIIVGKAYEKDKTYEVENRATKKKVFLNIKDLTKLLTNNA